jgi:hypothetical protein
LAVDLEDIDSLDRLLVVAGAIDGDPAPSDFGAAAEYTQGLEIERGLGGGAADESTDVREGDCSLLWMAGYISWWRHGSNKEQRLRMG